MFSIISFNSHSECDTWNPWHVFKWYLRIFYLPRKQSVVLILLQDVTSPLERHSTIHDEQSSYPGCIPATADAAYFSWVCFSLSHPSLLWFAFPRTQQKLCPYLQAVLAFSHRAAVPGMSWLLLHEGKESPSPRWAIISVVQNLP